MSALDALIVRAAGLGTRLIPRETRTRLASVPDLHALARELGNLGFVIPQQSPAPADLELAIRRSAAERLRLLARWDVSGGVALVFFAELERRAVRALVRGLAEGLAPSLRLAGLLPTPGLPERALEELARQQEMTGLLSLLTTLRSPWAEALVQAKGSEPNLLLVELSLARLLARQLHAGAARLRGAFRDYARESLDLENIATALLVAGRKDELDVTALFLPGGAEIHAALFREAAAAEDRGVAAHRLAAALADRDLASRLATLAGDPVALDRAIADWRLAAWNRRARLDPLGAAPVIAYALRLDAEVRALQRIIWAVALAAPPALRLAPEVTR